MLLFLLCLFWLYGLNLSCFALFAIILHYFCMSSDRCFIICVQMAVCLMTVICILHGKQEEHTVSHKS